ncbi:MAG: bile acid:sodium symporter [Marinilabiliaceae bacterium]|nr:bile acid:sodium symporter [Marinilabiliaceae bacterium]
MKYFSSSVFLFPLVAKKFKIDFFIPALLLAIVIGKMFPQPALYDGIVNFKTISNLGIFIVFLFYGIKLNLSTLKRDIGNWKLHFIIQLSTFLLFPLIVLPFVFYFKEQNTGLLWIGGFFLATLPSTVSSSVVFISIAKGNIPSAIFNATFSSLAGIIFTPLWMSLIITSGNEATSSDFFSIILKLLTQVLIPLIIGMFLNRFFGKWAEKNNSSLRKIDQSVILLIVYLSFAKSFHENQFQLVSIIDLLLTTFFCFLLLLIVYQIITFICYLLKLPKEDIITAQISGSNKSLIHGTVMSNLIFGGMVSVGLILLPLMIYHSLQLIIMGIIAKRKHVYKGT